MYAVVKSGGRQYRVAVGDVLDVNRLTGQRGDTVSLPAVLVVDGDTVTSAADELAALPVTGEVVEHTRGPKIRILKYKNKTGYRKRQGHRQELTRLKVTGIGAEQPAADAKADPRASTKSDAKASTKTDAKAGTKVDTTKAEKKKTASTEEDED